VKKKGQNWLDMFHWGFVPYWAKGTAIGSRMINARSVTIAEKPSFKHAFRRQRCLLPARGYYEWQKVKGAKLPVLITLPDGKPFAIAGLWDIWKKTPAGQPMYQSCAMVTKQASGTIQKIHHRMPVILQPEVYEPWLDPGNRNIADLKQILDSATITHLVSTPATACRPEKANQLPLFK
jgi:putative SOS response-associated peptidase YedK